MHNQATFRDLLDRILDKGVVVNADVVISLGDVPLLGLNLRAVLAGMETMLHYGLLADMDRTIRTEAHRAAAVGIGRDTATGAGSGGRRTEGEGSTLE